MRPWLLLHYKIPTEPSALRVYIWRKIKRIGAILYEDAVWVLPATPRNLEQFQWLAAEIIEMDGSATLWEAQLANGKQDGSLVQQFLEQVNEGYRQILEQLEHREADLETLSRQYQQVKMRDYFQSELGQRVRGALLAARGAGL